MASRLAGVRVPSTSNRQMVFGCFRSAKGLTPAGKTFAGVVVAIVYVGGSVCVRGGICEGTREKVRSKMCDGRLDTLVEKSGFGAVVDAPRIAKREHVSHPRFRNT